jgi:hypothetical protein
MYSMYVFISLLLHGVVVLTTRNAERQRVRRVRGKLLLQHGNAG